MPDKQPQHPTNDDQAAWKAFWTAQGMPWRTEPEIDENRQSYLAARRAIQPDIARGIYPFRDDTHNIKLTRADVEWLLETHESGGRTGPVDWQNDFAQDRMGLDVRGADLRGENLRGLPLTRLCAGLALENGHSTTFLQTDGRLGTTQERRVAVVNLEGANLTAAHLEGANLTAAHLEGANLTAAHLEGANLTAAHLEGANLTDACLMYAHLRFAHLDKAIMTRADLSHTHLEAASLKDAVVEAANLSGSFFDDRTNLSRLILTEPAPRLIGRRRSQRNTAPQLADVAWSDAIVEGIPWSSLTRLGDERVALELRDSRSKRKDDTTRASEFERAARAYRQVAIRLAAVGINDQVHCFRYRAYVCDRRALCELRP
jgi:uncharacterized protein YjbI with pentapeptide repeats